LILSEARTNVLGGLNELVAEQNMEFGSPVDSHILNETGKVVLDGRQAVAYARIRKVGNGDYARSRRQIEVLKSLMTRFMNLSIDRKETVMEKILTCISTNMNENDIFNYALTFLPGLDSPTFEYMQVPIDGYSNAGMFYDLRTYGEWSIRTDWNGMIPILQEYIFGKTFAFDPVMLILGAPVVSSENNVVEDETNPGGY